MFKDFFKKYNSLPEYEKDTYNGIRNSYNYYPKFWFIDNNYILKEMNGDVKNINFYWKALLFSFLSKSVHRCSPENYHYCLDYLSLNYGIDFRFIFRNKLQLFLDLEFNKIDTFSNLKTVDYSLENIHSYASWLVEVVVYLNKQCCVTDLSSRLLVGEKDNYFMEEFSVEVESLSFQFYKTYFKALSDVR